VMMKPEIYEKTEIGAHKVRSLKRALDDLRSGKASFLAIADVNPVALWIRVVADENDPDTLWVAQTDVNSAKNQSYAQTTAWKMSVKEFIEVYNQEMKEYKLALRAGEAGVYAKERRKGARA